MKVTNNKAETHYLKFNKGKAYYLTKDVPDETYTDENISSYSIEVMVIELKG